MAKKKELTTRARDELFSHINRCGVLNAAEKDQKEWMTETIEYLGERYPDLTELELAKLHDVGLRFCRPAIPHGDEHDATEESEKDADAA